MRCKPKEISVSIVKRDFSVLVSRLVVEYMLFFTTDYKELPICLIMVQYISHILIAGFTPAKHPGGPVNENEQIKSHKESPIPMNLPLHSCLPFV